MYGCESWTVRKAECWRIDALNCGVGEDSWESLDCKKIQPVYPKGNQSWIFIEGLRLKLQYFGHLMWRTDSLEKTLVLGKTEGRRRGWQRMRWLDGITDSDVSLSWWWKGKPGVLMMSMGLQRVGYDWVTELNWAEWDRIPWSYFLKYLVLSQLFHFPPSPSSRHFLIPLCFLPLKWYHPHIWGCWCFSLCLDSSL